MERRLKLGMVAITAVSLLWLGFRPAAFAAPAGKPIVIGYVGNVASPGTKPCMDIQKYAVEEVNKAGGILGRPVEYVVLDGKGDTSLSVEAARRLLMENKATFVSIEGRSEICLAAQENSAALFKEYPHILVFNGPMASELTARIVDNYEKYKFCFRDWDPEPAHYSWLDTYFIPFKQIFKAKKIAFLWEDLAWTIMWRRGIEYLKLPTWEEVAKQKYGMDVVYSKPVKPRGTMYLPILQEIATRKAEVIWFVSSWFTDTESYAKQWSDSAAKNIPTVLYGGVAQTHDFWRMTGGKGLGIVSSFYEGDIPFTEKTLPFIALGKKLGIPLQIHVHIAYADIYHFKAAIERAGGTDDVEKLIKAMEEIETIYSLGKMKYETHRIKPYFHSRILCDPSNPYYMYPGVFLIGLAQFQKEGEVRFITGNPGFEKYVNAKNYIPPAQLREK
jgi:ABC-type branched-subunit amino acid transport system substrate-binding protein